EAGALRELETALELLDAVAPAVTEPARADVVERVREDVGLAEALRELDRALAPRGCAARVARQHPQLGDIRERHRQLAAGQRLEQHHCALRVILGARVV